MRARRIVVIGASGSGKTTVGRRLAHLLDLPFTDLDALFWEPGWTHAPADLFTERVRAVVGHESWVISGNYLSRVADLIWPAADLLVWLDLPRTITFGRVVRRTVLDAARRRELWPGCRQHWTTAVRTRLFPIAWAQREHHRMIVPDLLRERIRADAVTLRFTGPGQVRRWLADPQVNSRP